METIEIGERIKELRLGRNLSHVALAKELKLNPQTVRDYEAGRRSPTIKGLPAIARSLGVTVTQLIDGSDELPPLRVEPVSKSLAKMMNIPDEIYELAASLSKNDKVWRDDVIPALTLRRDEIKKEAKRSAKQS